MVDRLFEQLEVLSEDPPILSVGVFGRTGLFHRVVVTKFTPEGVKNALTTLMAAVELDAEGYGKAHG